MWALVYLDCRVIGANDNRIIESLRGFFRNIPVKSTVIDKKQIDALKAPQNRSSIHSRLRWLAPGEDFHSRHSHGCPGNV